MAKFVDKHGKEFKVGDYVIDCGIIYKNKLTYVSQLTNSRLQLKWDNECSRGTHNFYDPENAANIEIISKQEAIMYILKTK